MGPILKHGFSRAAVAATKFITWLLTLVLRFTIHGLETRNKYVFRVKSVSHAGNSDYSEESEAILVKAAISKDSSQLNQKKNQTKKANWAVQTQRKHRSSLHYSDQCMCDSTSKQWNFRCESERKVIPALMEYFGNGGLIVRMIVKRPQRSATGIMERFLVHRPS